MAGPQAARSGRTFHVDPTDGDDANDGLTPSRPIKTYADRQFTGGDRILFKRGSVIRDILHTSNGTDKAPITYGAYGEGTMPAFLGSMSVSDPQKWVAERPSVWRYAEPLPSEACNVVFNDGQSCGTLCWQIDDLKESGQWHYTGLGKQRGGERLYLCSPTNPGQTYASIECVLWGQRKLVGGQHNIILENLSFRNSGVHGYQEFHARQIVIRNCEFRFIGGAVWHRERRMRFGNAIELWDGASDVTVEGCRFDNIYDSGVTHQGGKTRNIPERIHFRNNLFVDCGLVAYECREPSQEVYFEHNTCVNTGGGFSAQGRKPPRPTDPYPQPVGYHVWVWMIDPGTQPGNVYIRHNVFCESTGPSVCLSIDQADEKKFVLDHNSYWQTNGQPLVLFSKSAKNWAKAQEAWEKAGGPLADWGCRRAYTPAEFRRYQAECGQDAHSRVAEPRFVDPTRADYRQRADSPCRDLGLQADFKKT
jgi:hypothetical protein